MAALPITPKDHNAYVVCVDFADRDDGSIEITFTVDVEGEPTSDFTFVWPQDSLADFVSTMVSRSSLAYQQHG